jgi:hypothetical protein
VTARDIAVSLTGDGATAGFSVTRDGTDPDASVDVVDESWQLTDLPEGVSVLKARAVSRAGVAGPVGRGLVRVDRTAPSLRLLGAGDPLTPHPGPITVSIGASDLLSGMAPAEDSEPVTNGAYVAYALDGGAETRVGGDEAQVPVAGEGWHTLVYWAVDGAGNRAPAVERRIEIRKRRDYVGERFGFWATSRNPATHFTASTSFGDACPPSIVLEADRNATTSEATPDDVVEPDSLRIDATLPRRARSLIGFPLPSASGCALLAAELRLTRTTGDPVADVAVCRASAAWSEAAVTWATQPGCVGTVATDTDVTEIVQALYRHGDNGLLIRSTAEATAFESRASATASARPRLTLRFAQ